ncbi:MAG: glycosyltransferase family 4 protein [Gemmatimonadota bacterium]
MNILLVNWQDRENPQAGGAEVHLFEIFSRLAARGHRIRLVCSGWQGAPSEAVTNGISITRSGDRNSFTLVGRAAVKKALALETPDVLVEDINKLPLFLGGLTRAPLYVIIPHLFGDTIFHEASFPAAALVWLAERPVPWAYRRAAFHAISESTGQDLEARGVPGERIRVIHPGVDSLALTPSLELRSAAPAFLYLGRLKRYKGVETAIRALAVARQSRPDLTLDIAGTGDDRPRLEMISAGLGLTGAVRFHGFVSEKEKLRLLRSTWATVFPSPKEGWGITIIEAAACGTPSLASDSPGLRDSVRNGETGFLVPHGDGPALAARMLQLAANPDLIRTLGTAARHYAESLTWEGAAAETEQHLETTIRNQGGVPTLPPLHAS